MRLQEWLNVITSEIHAGSGPLFNKELPEAVQDISKTRLFKRFDLIDATLAKHAYLMCDSFTVADAYPFTVLGWMAGFSINLEDWPSIADYIRRIEVRPSVITSRAREATIPAVE